MSETSTESMRQWLQETQQCLHGANVAGWSGPHEAHASQPKCAAKGIGVFPFH
jgi:hypothetical protein